MFGFLVLLCQAVKTQGFTGLYRASSKTSGLTGMFEIWEKGAGLIHFSYRALSIFRILNYVSLRMQIMSISRTPGTCMSQLAHKPHAVTNLNKAG